MADNDLQAIGQLANLPIGELFRSVALGIAEAQSSLDEASMAVAELMSGTRINADGTPVDSRVFFGFSLEEENIDNDKKKVIRKPERLSMIELGFTPTFYQFVDTVIEIKLAVSLARVEASSSPPPGETAERSRSDSVWSAGPRSSFAVTATPVDAAYSSSYNFKGEFVSTFKTKLVPIPPPALLEDRIRLMIERQRETDAGNLSLEDEALIGATPEATSAPPGTEPSSSPEDVLREATPPEADSPEADSPATGKSKGGRRKRGK